MTFRDMYGLLPKPIPRCPLCGVETRRRCVCKCLGRLARSKRRGLVRLVAACVDEARDER